MNDFDISERGIALGLSWDILVLIGLAGLFIFLVTMAAETHAAYFENSSPRLWFNRNYVLVIMVAGFGGLALALNFYLLEIMQIVAGLVDRLRENVAEGDSETEDLRNLAYATGILLASVVAAATLFFTLIKVWVNERNTRTVEEGHITDRIAKAVEQIGTEKTVKSRNKTGEVSETTEPNLEVRIGGLLSLERIARDNLPDHVQVMEILCAYIRQAAKDQIRRDPVPEYDGEFYDGKGWKTWARENRRPPRDDLRVAFNILERRSPKQKQAEQQVHYRLDLKRVNLTCLDLQRIKLGDALLTQASLRGVNLGWAEMQGIRLNSTKMQGAKLTGAKIQGAKLREAELSGAELNEVQMHGADLRGAKMDRATSLEGASFAGAALSLGRYSYSRFSEEQIKSAFGDRRETLPNHFPKPDHWVEGKLEWDEYKLQWRVWQKSIGFEPDNPEGSA